LKFAGAAAYNAQYAAFPDVNWRARPGVLRRRLTKRKIKLF
jgi:hypothetical protein